MTFPKIGAELVLEKGQFSRGMKSAATDASRLDKQLDDLIDTTNKLDAAVVNIAVDATIGGKLDEAQRIVSDLDAARPDVTISATDSALDAAADIVDDLDAARPDVTVTATDSELRSVEGRIEGIDSAAPDVDVKEGDTGELSLIERRLDKLQELATVSIVIGAAGLLTGGLGELPIISTLIETEQLIADITARTGETIPDLGNMIDTFWTQNWGDSKKEIADVITALSNLGLEGQSLFDATEAAFQASAIIAEDPLTTINALNALVANELVPNFAAAADFIVRAQQEGLNTSGEFLDIVTEYSQQFADAGFSAEEMFRVLDQGLEAGVFDPDKIADLFKEASNLIREEVSALAADPTATTPRTEALEAIGQLDEAQAFEQGQLTAGQFFDGVIAALREQPEEIQRILSEEIFSPTQIEEVGLPVVLAFEIEGEGEFDAEVQGAATRASDIMFNTLKTAFTGVGRTLETSVVQALDQSLDITGKLNTLRDKLNVFSSELTSGAGIGEALEVALEIPGLEMQISRLESILGNVTLAIVNAFAAGLDIIGQGEAAQELRDLVAPLAEGQLAFDLKIGNAEEIASVIEDAQSTGQEELLQTAAEIAAAEFIEEGDVAGARALADAFTIANEQAQEIDAVEFLGDVSPLAIIGNVTAGRGPLPSLTPTAPIDTEFIDAFTQQIDDAEGAIDDAINAGNFELALTLAEESGQSELVALVQETMAEVEAEIIKGRTLVETAAGSEGGGMFAGIATDATDAAAAISIEAGSINDSTLAIGENTEETSRMVHDAIWGNSIVPDFQNAAAEIAIQSEALNASVNSVGTTATSTSAIFTAAMLGMKAGAQSSIPAILKLLRDVSQALVDIQNRARAAKSSIESLKKAQESGGGGAAPGEAVSTGGGGGGGSAASVTTGLGALGVRGSSVINNTNIVLTQNNAVANGAEGFLASNELTSQIRGFA